MTGIDRHQIVFSPRARGGDGTAALCLPWLITPFLILLLGSVLPDRLARWAIYGIAFVLSLPALPLLVHLLKMLWTRQEVVLHIADRTITECSRTPWRVASRRHSFDAVLSVRVIAHRTDPDYRTSIALELLRNEQISLACRSRTTEALDLAWKVSQLLGVRIQGVLAR
jgi:hypothetical protein